MGRNAEIIELGPAAGSSSGGEVTERCRAPGVSLTGQKAEPVEMKLTLFLSGQEKSGTDADCLELDRQKRKVRDAV